LPHKDPVRLEHIIEAAQAALRYVHGVARDDLERDDMRARAIVQAVGVIGEAASRLTPELRARYPDVPWGTMIGMRNRLVHGYFEINYLLVWDTVNDDLPGLIDRMEEIVAAETAAGDG
jgi:uncharacterized protein with HEPN domain